MKALDEGFADDGYRLPELMRRIATSEAMVRIAPAAPQTAAAGAPRQEQQP
jgi:hypothetical protein